MAEISNLKKKRGYIKSKLTRFGQYMQEFDISNNIGALESRLEKAVQFWQEFDLIQTEIESLEVAEDPEVHSTDRISFENAYYDTIGAAKDIIRTKTSLLNSVGHASTSNAEPVANVKLPTLNLPVFNGNYEEWLPFYDSFNALIHTNSQLAKAQKFYYLKSCLKGTAAEVIHSLEASADNYEVAWTLLQTRFEHKRLIVYNHVKSLFEITQVTKESSSSVRCVLDNMLKHIRALQNLKQPVETWDTLIIYLISTKLDVACRKEWEGTLDTNTLPTLQQFEEFLTKRAQVLETVEVGKGTNKPFSPSTSYKNNNYFNKARDQVMSYVTTDRSACVICNEASHPIYSCMEFKKLPTTARIEEVKRHKLCLNCLKSNHYIRECQASGCKICHKKHNTLLHLTSTQAHRVQTMPNVNQVISDVSTITLNENSNSNTIAPGTSGGVTLCTFKNQSKQVLLSTARALVLDKYGGIQECRILLDSGSQSNFITQELCDRLQLEVNKISIPVGGINQTTTTITHKTSATIRSRFNIFQATLPFLILQKITEKLPREHIHIDQLQIPDNIILADDTFYTPGKIDMLLGANIFWELLCDGRIKLTNQQPILQKTKFGWIISGNIMQQNKEGKTLCHFSTNSNISKQLERFWKIEEVQEISNQSLEEKNCENHFKETHKHDKDGRFIVRLPFKDSIFTLGESKQTALKRLFAMERKFEKQPEVKMQYVQFMNEYKELAHMTEVNDKDDVGTSATHYLPHHAVVKEASTTTKLRVVFDGSCKTSSGVSINDILMVGPTIQQDLFSIILRFRQHRYVVTADIEKMYRQIRIHDNDQHLLRIVWRPARDQPIKTFKLNTVTYGTATAPFQAIRCLHQLAIENQQFPEACDIILRDFYVDDLLTGDDSVEMLRIRKQQISTILDSAGFKLRKWMSNEPTVLDRNFNQNLELAMIGNEEIKTLGLLWRPSIDEFRFKVKLQAAPHKITKRIILSTIAQIYDPLGLVGPCTIKGKIMLQKLWKLKCGWDELLPQELSRQWNNYYGQLTALSHVMIPRHVVCCNPVKLEIHAFCDASEVAYGSCIYLKSIDQDQNTVVRLLCAKSRVAPLKTISLPRLELCGALLLAKLLRNAKQALTLTVEKIYCWSDSTVALSWISGQPCQWKTFVANRVAEIQELTQDASWRHVKSEDNPADVISRGMEPNQLVSFPLWWNGPTWLMHDSSDWIEHHQLSGRGEEVLESKGTLTLHSLVDNFQIFQMCSSLSKLQSIVAYWLRFRHNTVNSNSRITGALGVDELKGALERLIKLAHIQEFQQEINALRKNQAVKHSSKLITLNPFLDKAGIIRVGGRLRYADVPEDQKYPMVLPAHHALTEMIIRHEHYKQLHAGPQQILASLRCRYWPLSGRTVIRRVLHKCIVCFRARPRNIEQLMGNLPKNRLTPSRAFLNCGVDYGGPFTIKLSRNKTARAYLCLFVCLSTKAVHLELVTDLTTQVFLNALKRFTSRRGRCVAMYSDNGTNFSGANNQLNALAKLLSNPETQSKIIKYCAEEYIKWHFIPPRAPHFGGLWEAGIKSVKTHLYRVVGNALLSFEELYTVITQIEACLNSRPLTPLSIDPTDFTALTPGHFLIGEALTALPQESVINQPSNRLTRYQHLSQMVQHFWVRWSKEYLNQLQQRTKWQTKNPAIVQPGTLVVLREDNLPPLQWKLGRVVQCFPGDDGIVRVVSIKTISGVYKRPITRVCVLPIETNN